MAPVTHRILGVLAVGLIPIAVMPSAAPAFGQAPASASPIDRWQGFIAEASHRFDIPEAWIRAVMQAESGGHAMLDGQPITSRAGAMGLMQIMPETWAELRGRYGLGADPYDPSDNILAGTAYLRDLYARYGYPNLLAAYNAGPARFDEYLFDGQPLPDETRTYLAVLGQPDFEEPRTSVTPAGTGLFFTLYGVAGGSSAQSGAPSSGSLFLPLNSVRQHKP